jgi:hypothetical protein
MDILLHYIRILTEETTILSTLDKTLISTVSISQPLDPQLNKEEHLPTYIVFDYARTVSKK